MLLFCYPYSLLSWYPVILISCYSVILLFCYPVILLSCYSVILISCYSVIMLFCYPDILLSCYSVLQLSSLLAGQHNIGQRTESFIRFAKNHCRMKSFGGNICRSLLALIIGDDWANLDPVSIYFKQIDILVKFSNSKLQLNILHPTSLK